MSNTKKRYKEDLKKQLVELYNFVLELYNLGKSVTELSDEYGVTPPTIYSWIKLYSIMDGPDKEDIIVSDYKKIKKEIELLRVENEILKNDPHIHKRQIETKISFIKKYKNKYYIYLMCDILKISRSSDYNHLNKVKSKSKLR